MKIWIRILLMGCCLMTAQAEEWEYLLDKDLSKFEIWMGVPHSSVTGLPEGTPQSEEAGKGIGVPMGLDNDVKNVFTMIEEDGEPVLYITGEIYGGLTTLKEYGNYHMSLQVKWGEKKWPPRLNLLRDSGIIYHSYGAERSFWQVWKSGLECQVQETDMGDFISIAGPKVQIRVNKDEKRARFDKTSDIYASTYTSAYPEPDSPHGEWNTIEIYTVGNTAVHLCNGQVVMVVEEATFPDGTPLTKGQIQIQSEAAECYYKDFKIRSIDAFPPEIRKEMRLKGE
ncbi:MAG: DUF1080 domain-containing protein [Verrucomicrobiota bacterium]